VVASLEPLKKTAMEGLWEWGGRVLRRSRNAADPDGIKAEATRFLFDGLRDRHDYILASRVLSSFHPMN